MGETATVPAGQSERSLLVKSECPACGQYGFGDGGVLKCSNETCRVDTYYAVGVDE